MRIPSALVVLILPLALGPQKDRAGGVLAYVSPPPSSKASVRNRNVKTKPHSQVVSALKESPVDGNFDGFQRAQDEAQKSSLAQNNPTAVSRRSNVEQMSEVVASAAINDDATRLKKEVEASAKELKVQQEELERLRAQRDEILREFAGPVAAAWLTPLAALGAGRAYLQRREAVQAEVGAAKVELEARRAELERKERQLGRAVSYGSSSQRTGRSTAEGKPKRNKLNVSRSINGDLCSLFLEVALSGEMLWYLCIYSFSSPGI